MKNILLLLLLFTGIVNAQIVNIPDLNFKNKLLQADLTNTIAYTNGLKVKIDTNNDGEIQEIEAQVIDSLNVPSSNIIDLSGILSFNTLKKLDCSSNLLNSLNLVSLNSIVELNCNSNSLFDLYINGLSNLRKLSIVSNNLTTLNLSGLTNLENFNCNNNNLNGIPINSLSNLKILSMYNNGLNSINLVGLSVLEEFYCDGNNLTALNVNTLSNLKILNCSNNNITSFSISGLNNLEEINCGNNIVMTSLVLNSLPSLKKLSVYGTTIGSFNATVLPNLEYLSCGGANLNSLVINGMANLAYVSCPGNSLTSLNLNNLPTLNYLNCIINQISTLDFSSSPSIANLYCGQNLLNTFNVSGLNNLQLLECGNNQMTSIDFGTVSSIQQLDCNNNLLTSINLSNLTSLFALILSNNQLTTLSLSTNTQILYLDCNNNLIGSLDVSSLANMLSLSCSFNPITSLDISNSQQLNTLNCTNTNASTLFLKNGFNTFPINFQVGNNSNLNYICIDDFNISAIQNQVSNTVVINSYCTFIPGGNYNTITGKILFDLDNNGCDANDLPQPNIRMNLTQSSVTNATFSNNLGIYTFYTTFSNQTIAPSIENPTWFNLTPVDANISFTGNNDTINQDFCISANGVHNDVEVIIAPINVARPGFDAKYKVVYKNKGNQINSGTVTFSYNDSVLDYVSSSVSPNAQATGLLTFNYTNLLPFESRSFEIVLNVNAPTETPAVNIGDILNYTAIINPIVTDENPNDNTFEYHQTVVGALDPNDITCLEGASVSPSQIGNYLHYIINFENVGNFPAENIVLKDIIDESIFDVSTLQVMNSSNQVSARVKGNIAEFIFQNINLDSGGHGNILIKIKTKSTIQTGAIASKNADIFFDYNAPVNTGMANTTFAALNNGSFELDKSISVYPNPTSSIINIISDTEIKNIQLYDVQGRILQTTVGNSNTIDISDKNSGIYFLKISTENGSKVEKISKE